MAITVKHTKVSTIPDGDDSSLIRPSDWNDDHQLTGTVPVANGGTGAATLTGYVKGNGTSNMTASTTIPSTDVTGLGTMSAQNANNVAVTGGTVSGTTLTSDTVSNNLTFTPTSAPSYVEGELWYDSTQKSLAYYNDITNNTLHIGQEVQLKVINNTGSTINIGQPVYVTGTSSGQTYPNVALAIANTLTTANVIGLANQNIASGSAGYVTTIGLIQGINTGSYTVGDTLYLSPYSAGFYQNTIPPTGYAVKLGTVAYVNSSNGAIYINKSNLSVQAGNIVGTVAVANGGTGQTTYTDGQLLIGNSTGNTLTKSTLTAGTGISVTNSAGGITIANTSPSSGGTVTSITAGTGLSGGTITSSGTIALANTTVSPGSYTNSSITVDAQGRLTSASSGTAPVTSVTGTSPVVSSGGTTPAISLASGYGDTQNPYASKTANNFLAAPNGSSGAPTFRAIVAADVPTLNQNTTGSAAKWTTARTESLTGDITGSTTVDGSANYSIATTLATVNSNVGTFTKITANGKGLVTAASQASLTDLSSPTASFSFGSQNLTNLLDPVNAQDAATKLYVDNTAQGLDAKASVVAATTASITLVGGQVIDGVTVVSGDRVLVKNQSSAAANGIYVAQTTSWTRATDMDTWAEVPNAYVWVESGTTQADTGWVCTSNAGGTIGTTAITWVQFAGAGSYTAGTGLTLTGTQFAIDSTVATLTGSQTLTNKTISGSNNTLSNIGNSSLTNSAITINGTSTSLGGSISVGTVTAVTGTAPVVSSGGTAPAISMAKATTLVDGYLSAIDWNTFNNKQPAGSYLTAVTASAPLSGSGTAGSPLVISQATTSTNGYLSSTDWNTFNNKGSGTVTSVSALTLGTTGTDLSSTVATGTTTPVITLNVPTASASNRGALSSTDWSTFNGKQAALVSGTNIKTVNGTSLLGSGDVPVGVLTVTGTAPVVSSGGANPAISMPAATGSVNGYLTSTDWTTFNSKGNGTVTSVTATSPVTSTGGTTPVIAMPAATTSVNGYLTSTDWTTFNGKYSVGGALGTPSSATLTNATGLPVGGISATGTPSATTYLRGDGSWSTVSATSANNLSGGALGSVPYQLLSGSTTFLSGNTTTTPQFLTSTGVAGLATAPTYTSSTGSGNVVLATSPTLVTPALGTPSALVGTNITGTASGLSIGGAAPAGSLSGTTLNSSVVSSSLTSVGTIGTGTWQGTAIGATYGGTAQTTYTTGDILYASASNTLSKLPIGSTGQVLTVTSGAPAWGTASSSNITAQGLYENSATISANYTIGTGNNAISAGPITVATGVTVTVPTGSTWTVV